MRHRVRICVLGVFLLIIHPWLLILWMVTGKPCRNLLDQCILGIGRHLLGVLSDQWRLRFNITGRCLWLLLRLLSKEWLPFFRLRLSTRCPSLQHLFGLKWSLPSMLHRLILLNPRGPSWMCNGYLMINWWQSWMFHHCLLLHRSPSRLSRLSRFHSRLLLNGCWRHFRRMHLWLELRLHLRGSAVRP